MLIKKYQIWFQKLNKYIIENPDNSNVNIWDVIDLQELLNFLPSQKLKTISIRTMVI